MILTIKIDRWRIGLLVVALLLYQSYVSYEEIKYFLVSNNHHHPQHGPWSPTYEKDTSSLILTNNPGIASSKDHLTNGKYIEHDFKADQGDKVDEGGKADDVIPNKSKAGEGDLTNFIEDESGLSNFKADERYLISTRNSQTTYAKRRRSLLREIESVFCFCRARK